MQANATFAVTDAVAAKVKRLEDEIQKLPQVVIAPVHHVHGRMYARTGLIPQGTTFTGAVHKKDHINVVCGDITLLSNDGPLRLTGYHVLPTCAGSKRVAYAHADTMWTTLAQTDLADIAEIEDELVEDSGALQTRKFLEN